MKKLSLRSKDSGSALVEYVLAVSLLGLAMVGVMQGFVDKTRQVGEDFKLATGSGEFCNPSENPFGCP